MIIVKGKIKLEKTILELNGIDTNNLFNFLSVIIKLGDQTQISNNTLGLPELDQLHEFSQFVFSLREKLLPYIDLNLVGLSETNRLPDEKEDEN